MSKRWLALCVALLLLSVGGRAEGQKTSTAEPETMPAGLRHIGGGVSAPILIHRVDWVHTREDKQLALPRGITLSFIVDEHGEPIHVHVVQGDAGLGERLIEAVKQYRFKPAMEDGKPVMVDMNMIFNID